MNAGDWVDGHGRILSELASALRLAEDEQPFGTVIDAAEAMTFIRDPFDRIIVAQAVAADAILATKDDRIRSAYPDRTLWARSW